MFNLFFDSTWVILPLFFSVLLLAVLWAFPPTKGFAESASFCLGVVLVILLVFVIAGFGGPIVFIVVLVGPLAFLLYVVLGGVAASTSHSGEGTQGADQQKLKSLRNADGYRWGNYVVQLNACGFSSKEIETDLVGRGVSEIEAKIIVLHFLRARS